MPRPIKFRAQSKLGKPVVFDLMVGFPEGLADPKTVEQFTGLTNRHGKEIYEGDIVRWSDHLVGEDFTGSVGFFGAGFHIHHKSEDKTRTVEGWIGLPLNDEDQSTLEIIGNIHENPELLEVKNA